MLFLLFLHLFILSGIISPLISSSILGTYWSGEFIFQCPIFLPFHTVHGVLKAKMLKWFMPFPSLVDHFLSELSTMTCLSWVALYSMSSEWFMEWYKAVVSVIRLLGFLFLWFSFYLPCDGQWQEASESFLLGVTDLGGNWVLVWWKAMLSKSLVQFPVDGWGHVLSLFLTCGQIWWR